MPKRHEESQFASVLKWSVPLCFALIFLAVWLLAKGSKGVDISGALSLPATVLSMAVSILIYKLQERSNRTRRMYAGVKPHPASRGWKLAALATAVVFGTGGPVIYWQVIHKPDLPVTDMVQLTGGQAMADGSEAVLKVPGTPPSRHNLAITLGLDNPAGLGDCIQPAQLNLVPELDGSARKSTSAVPGTETRIHLNGVTHAAIIDVFLREPDPACRVNLIVSDAVLFNLQYARSPGEGKLMRRTRKTPALLASFTMVACVAVQVGCSSTTTPVSPTTPPATSTALIAGVGTDAPGWSWLTVGSDARNGFDIDLVRWLAQRRNVFPSFVDISSSERIPALQNHQVNIVVDTFSMTDERRKKISFAGPYMITKQGFLVRAGDNRIRSLGDLAGKIVCTARGTTSLAQLQQLNNGPLDGRMTITQEDSENECVSDLKARTADAVSTDQLILAGLAAANSSHGLTVIPNITFGEQERYGIGLPLGDIADCQTYTADLRDFIISGQWTQFFQQEFPGIPTTGHEPTPEYLDPCQ